MTSQKIRVVIESYYSRAKLKNCFGPARVHQKRSWRGSLLWALALATPAAFAGHPMLSEDTGTQGIRNAELELGYAWSQDHGADLFLFQPQLSYGTSTTFDLILQPSWTYVDAPGTGPEKGLGDTNVDVKWRFYGAAPWSLGVRAGVEVPTAHSDLGLANHKVSPHGLLVLTGDLNPITLDANLGVALLEMIYTVRPGFDLDVGYRGRLNTAAPIRQFLLGITYRGAL
jgi:hypothetical protein